MSSFEFDSITSIDATGVSSSATISTDESDKLVQALVEKLSLSKAESQAALAIICQKGGTAKTAQGTVYAKVNNKKVELNTVRSIMKEKNLNFTLRKWARTNADAIHRVAAHFCIEGDLAKKIARNNNNLSVEDKYWLSNFQMDNENCPQPLRELLMEHYKSLFPGKTVGKQTN